jgi:hypothetical protein
VPFVPSFSLLRLANLLFAHVSVVHASASAVTALFEVNGETAAHLGNWNSWSSEGNFSHHIVDHPGFMENMGASVSALTVFPRNYSATVPRLVRAFKSSKPELGMTVSEQGRGRPPLGFEWKSYDTAAFEELAQTGLGQIQSSFFVESGGGQSWKFYVQPPWALSALACGSALLVVFAAEMVGMLHFHVYAGACTIGDAQYAEHVAKLMSARVVAPYVDLRTATLKQCATVGRKVQWTSVGVDGYFYKLIRYDLFGGEKRSGEWRRLWSVYKAYQKLSTGGNDGMECTVTLPKALVPARMLYGEFYVAVQLPFLKDATELEALTDLTADETARIVEALAFLASNGLVYSDLRASNLVRSGGDVYLIDYDDVKEVHVADVRNAIADVQTVGTQALWSAAVEELQTNQ